MYYKQLMEKWKEKNATLNKPGRNFFDGCHFVKGEMYDLFISYLLDILILILNIDWYVFYRVNINQIKTWWICWENVCIKRTWQQL